MSDLREGGYDTASSAMTKVWKTRPGGVRELVDVRIVGPAEQLTHLDTPTEYPDCTGPECRANAS
ncbi:hypothetical protein ACFYXS_39515 [Streptomyces sp. NPDC002574]|uniref:hypothetical protein n=1 Tax=Streptomyces sp. NPDC002574 TaxID=3364652 RepID=UPI0036C7E3BD